MAAAEAARKDAQAALAELERAGGRLDDDTVLQLRLDLLIEMLLTPEAKAHFEQVFAERMAAMARGVAVAVRRARLTEGVHQASAQKWARDRNGGRNG